MKSAAAGLVTRLPVQHGFWPSGDPTRGVSYRDICVLGPIGASE